MRLLWSLRYFKVAVLMQTYACVSSLSFGKVGSPVPCCQRKMEKDRCGKIPCKTFGMLSHLPVWPAHSFFEIFFEVPSILRRFIGICEGWYSLVLCRNAALVLFALEKQYSYVQMDSRSAVAFIRLRFLDNARFSEYLERQTLMIISCKHVRKAYLFIVLAGSSIIILFLSPLSILFISLAFNLLRLFSLLLPMQAWPVSLTRTCSLSFLSPWV